MSSDLALLYNMPASPALDIEPLLEEGLCLAGLACQHLDSDVPVGVEALGSPTAGAAQPTARAAQPDRARVRRSPGSR